MSPIIVLFIGIIILSWSSIIIVWIGDLHPLIITFYRLLISGLVLLPFSLKKRQVTIKQIPKIKWQLFAAALFLALHFYTWITSLQMTTVGNSIFLESTHPLFGWILSAIILKESGSKKLVPAVLIGIVGMFVTVFNDMVGDFQALTGDFFAIASAFFIAAYLIFARQTSQKIQLVPYLSIVYLSAAGMTLIILLILSIPFWIIEIKQWGMLILLAIGPNLIGHSILNWASRKMVVYKVNMALLSESVMATIYAALLLDQIPAWNFYIGAIMILLSVYIVFRLEKTST